MGKYIRHGIGALVGLVLASIVGALGLEPTPEQQTTIVDGLAGGLSEFVMLVGYFVVEKYLKRFKGLDKEGFLDWWWLKKEASTTNVDALPRTPR